MFFIFFNKDCKNNNNIIKILNKSFTLAAIYITISNLLEKNYYVNVQLWNWGKRSQGRC
jgi:hypothetical protein